MVARLRTLLRKNDGELESWCLIEANARLNARSRCSEKFRGTLLRRLKNTPGKSAERFPHMPDRAFMCRSSLCHRYLWTLSSTPRSSQNGITHRNLTIHSTSDIQQRLPEKRDYSNAQTPQAPRTQDPFNFFNYDLQRGIMNIINRSVIHKGRHTPVPSVHVYPAQELDYINKRHVRQKISEEQLPAEGMRSVTRSIKLSLITRRNRIVAEAGNLPRDRLRD